MYYKVMKNNKVIDVLDRLIFLKYQPKHKVMILCEESEAQAILSSNQEHIWHVKGMYQIPVDGYETVTLAKIDKFEYDQLKTLNGQTPQEIIDAFMLSLIESGVL